MEGSWKITDDPVLLCASIRVQGTGTGRGTLGQELKCHLPLAVDDGFPQGSVLDHRVTCNSGSQQKFLC